MEPTRMPTDPLPTAPSPTQLAEAAVEADRLVVPDPTLVRAIVAEGASDEVVTTPEAAVGADQLNRLDRLDGLLDELDAPTVAIVRAADRVATSWRFTGDPVELTNTPLEREVAAQALASGWAEAALDGTEPLDGSIVCPAFDAFDPLQATVLPDDAEVITGTTEPAASWCLGETHTTLVEGLLAELEATDPGQIAVVGTGAIQGHATAALAAAGLTHPQPGPQGWEAVIELVAATASEGPVRVGDIRTLLAALDISTDGIDDTQPIDQLEGETAVWLKAVTDGAGELTIGVLCDQLAFRMQASPDATIDPVSALDVADQVPTRSVVADLRAYLDVARSTITQSSTGIDPCDARATWSTPRATVAYLAGDSWMRQTPPGGGTAWVQRERHRLAHLLAAGEDRLVFATDQDGPLGTWCPPTMATEIDPLERSSTGIGFSPEGRPRSGHDRFTKSQLNRLIASPRDALFSDILQRPARRALTRGAAIHDFADLLVAAPAGVDAVGRERIRSWIADRLAPFVPEHRSALVDTRLEAAMVVIEAYLDGFRPHPTAFEGYSSPWWMENTIAEAFDVAIERSVTEQYFKDETLGISGVIDLVRSPTHLVDFKTGSPPTIEQLVRRGRVPPSTRRADVQAPMYLTALRRRQPGTPLQMTFVYCHGSLPASLHGIPELDGLSRTIEYEPRPARLAIAAEETVDRLASAVPTDHPRATVSSVVPADKLEAALEAVDGSTEGAIDEVATTAERHGLDERVAVAGARSLVRAAQRWRRTTLFEDDLDRFEAFIEDWRRRRDGFDHEGYPLGDPLESRLDFADLHTDLSPMDGGRQ